MRINIEKDFSPITGGRTPKEGEFSGEDFREKILFPKYMECVEKDDKLEINFDNCYGIGTSFLEESFGGLVRNHGCVGVFTRLIIIATDDETIERNIDKYIKEAEMKLKARRK